MATASRAQRRILAAVTAAQVRVYRLSRGRLLNTAGGLPVLLLTTTGRRTGVRRTRPVAYQPDGDRYVVCGSYAGSDSTPAWVLNLQANPSATAEVGARTVPVTATEAHGGEHDRLWAALVAASPTFAGYQEKTSRRLPLLVLEPAGVTAAR